MPQMNDPNFERTVVLLCQHSTDGAFGLVVNRPVVTTAKVVAAESPTSEKFPPATTPCARRST